MQDLQNPNERVSIFLKVHIESKSIVNVYGIFYLHFKGPLTKNDGFGSQKQQGSVKIAAGKHAVICLKE